MSQIEIFHQTKAEVLAQLAERDDLIALIVQGYGSELTDKNEQIVFARQEYADGEINYFLVVDGQTVASLSVEDISSPENPIFFGQESELLANLGIHWETEPTIYWITGLVTHPEYRKQGFAQKLLQKFVEECQPDLIVSQTRTVAAVLARAKALDESYWTIFAGRLINSPDAQQNNFDQILTDIFYSSFGFSDRQRHAHCQTHILEDSPMVSAGVYEKANELPPPLDEVMQELNDRNIQQIEKKTLTTPMGLHISIRKSLFQN